MYSRDIFPRYTGGGMPIPENYSGNAVRRQRPSNETSAGNSSPRIHTSPARGNGNGGRGGQETRDGRGDRREEVTVKVAREAAAMPEVPSEEAGGGADAPADRDGFRGGGGESGSGDLRDREVERGSDGSRGDDDGAGGGRDAPKDGGGFRGGGQESEAVPASARGKDIAGMSSLISSFLPPKPGGLGVLGDVGIEELLLLGLFLLLSQSESEDDTLMLLALLFLYR